MTTLPQKLYVNVYAAFAGQSGTAYATRELADQMAARGRLACVEVDLASRTVGTIITATPFVGISDAINEGVK